MRAKDRTMARESLDMRLYPLRNIDMTRPPRGWIKAIREALGMTTRQFAQRVGVVQSRAVDIEKAEMSGSITLDSLTRAANALDCELVYVLIPRKPLKDTVNDQALTLAKRHIKSTSHSMALENQKISPSSEAEQLKILATQIAENSGSNLWNK
jgi:predicted DNA-binding mobile mystery protein A